MYAYGPFPPPVKPPEFLTEALAEIDQLIAEKGEQPFLLKDRAEILEMLEAYNGRL